MVSLPSDSGQVSLRGVSSAPSEEAASARKSRLMGLMPSIYLSPAAQGQRSRNTSSARDLRFFSAGRSAG